MLMSDVNEYHFVMDHEMKKKLKGLVMYKETGSLSGVIVRILMLLTPCLRKVHKWGKQRMSRYMLVTDDPDIKRDHVHAYIPGSLYRELKLMHQDLNVFSIAQLARGFLNFFLFLVEVIGDDVFKILKMLYKQWEAEDEKTRLSPDEFSRQLSIIIQHLPDQNRLITVYNRQFSPFWVFRL